MPTDSPGFSRLDPFEQAHLAAAELARRTGVERHDVLLVLGTGLSGAAAELGATDVSIDLSTLPGFPRYTGHGHRATAWSIPLYDKNVLVTSGRLHCYEGYSPHQVVHPIRTAIASGCHTLVLTNASGAIRRDLAPGDVVLIKDHLNLTGNSPLVGIDSNHSSGHPFVDMSDAWSMRLRKLAHKVAPTLPEGVYAQVNGPNLETPAEVQMIGALGADLVGMSTAVEAIAARHLGAELLGLSVVSNMAAGVGPDAIGITEIVDVSSRATSRLAELIDRILSSTD